MSPHGGKREGARDEYAYPLRMPAAIRPKLQEVAKKNHRSFNAEIVAAIERHIKAEAKIHGRSNNA